MIKYGLRNKKNGRLLTVYTRSNADGDFCCDIQHILIESAKPIEDIMINRENYDELWLVNSYEKAKKAMVSTEWYNANYETPTHDYDPDVLEVIKVEVSIKVEKA